MKLQTFLPYSRRPIVSTVASSRNGAEAVVEEYPPKIYPLQPEPFIYDPFHNSRSWIRKEAERIAETVRQSIEAQAEMLEQQFREQGATPMGARYQDPGVMSRMALRLYRAAICGLTVEQIADLELGEDPDAVPSGDAVRKTVSEWSRVLDVPLPRRKGGRRRIPDL